MNPTIVEQNRFKHFKTMYENSQLLEKIIFPSFKIQQEPYKGKIHSQNKGSVLTSTFHEMSVMRHEILNTSSFLPFKIDHLNTNKTTKTELKPVLNSMQEEICKTNPNVSMFSVKNFPWKNEESCLKPSVDQRSLVFNNENLHFKGYPYSIELTEADVGNFNTKMFNIFSHCRFFETSEGTMIRVFNIDNKWYTSTNKKLDALTSKWAAKKITFGIQLAIAVSYLINDNTTTFTGDVKTEIEHAREYLNTIWENSLDKNKKYFFLLKPCEEERIICDVVNDKIINIGVLDKDNNLSLDEDIKIVHPHTQNTILVPKPVERFFENEQVFFHELSILNPYVCPGFIAISVKDINTFEDCSKDIERSYHIKIFNTEYKYLFSLRGNVPSIRFRYFQLEYLKTKEFQFDPLSENTKIASLALHDFCQLYSSVINFEDVKFYIWNVIVADLFKKYQTIYINKQSLILNKKTHIVMSIIHNEYIESKYMKITDKKRISDILSCIKPVLLNQLVREYEDESKNN